MNRSAQLRGPPHHHRLQQPQRGLDPPVQHDDFPVVRSGGRWAPPADSGIRHREGRRRDQIRATAATEVAGVRSRNTGRQEAAGVGGPFRDPFLRVIVYSPQTRIARSIFPTFPASSAVGVVVRVRRPGRHGRRSGRSAELEAEALLDPGSSIGRARGSSCRRRRLDPPARTWREEACEKPCEGRFGHRLSAGRRP